MTMMPEAALYLRAKSTAEPRKAAPHPAASSLEAQIRPLRVLVVEDDPDTADSMQILLELLGYQAGVAYSGIAAVPTARHFQPDVVLCDLALPGMDGFAVAAALRQEPDLARVRLIAVSGYAPESAPCRQPTTFERHLVKPVALEELQATLQACRQFGTD